MTEIENLELQEIKNALDRLKGKGKKNSEEVIKEIKEKDQELDTIDIKKLISIVQTCENIYSNSNEETWKVLEAELNKADEKVKEIKGKITDVWNRWSNEQKRREEIEQELDDLTDLINDAQNKLGVKLTDLVNLDNPDEKINSFQLDNQGYSKKSIEEIKIWNLLSEGGIHIPNLKNPKRKGVVKTLSVSDDLTNEKGHCRDLIIFLRPFSSRLTPRDLIDEHNLNEIDSNLQIEHSLGISQEIKESNSRIIKSTIKDFIQNWNGNNRKWIWDVYVLVNKENYVTADKRRSVGHNTGTSADSAIYLALISAYLEIPLLDKVAVTGTFELSILEQELRNLEVQQPTKDLNIEKLELKREIEFLKATPIYQWKIVPIGGVEAKVKAAVKKGVKIIILPIGNQEDYEKLSNDIKKEIEKVVYVQKAEDLENFLWNQSATQLEFTANQIQNQPLTAEPVQSVPSFLTVNITFFLLVTMISFYLFI